MTTYISPEAYAEMLIDEIHEAEDKSNLPRGMIAHYMLNSERMKEGTTNYPMIIMDKCH